MIATHQVHVYASFKNREFNCSEGGGGGEGEREMYAGALSLFSRHMQQFIFHCQKKYKVTDAGLHSMERFKMNLVGNNYHDHV